MMPIRKNYDQNWLPNIFSDFFDNDWMPRTNATTPAINVTEDDKAYHIEVAAPGMTKDDFKVTLADEDHITVSLERKEEKNEDEEGKRYLRREFSYSRFQQTMSLPDDVDRDNITADMTDGVLHIGLQKKALETAQNQPRIIEIR